MKSRNRFFYLFVLVALVIVSLGTTGSASAQGSSIVCIPTCSATDGRMLSLASIGFSTLAGQTINLRIAVPAAMATFEVGVFDGDTGGIWDSGSTPLVYTVYADPMNTGQVTEQVAQWTGDTLLDNDWSSTIINQDPRAMAPSGDYFYNMQIVLPNAGTVETASNFKIRSNAPVELALNESFAYMAVAFPKNLSIIYPQYPTLTPTTFDGTWDLYLNVPSSTSSLTVWDGDVDYGSYTCTTNDTDDPDTPNNVLPSWAIGISDVPEGVATSVTNKCKNAAGKVVTGPEGQIYTTGFPADDTYAPQFLRSPSVNYELTDAKGNTYSNPNPSGNLEWEQFRIDSDPNAPADYHVDGLLSAGLYHLRITGLDMNNLNAWHLTYNQVCIHEDGSPCVPILHPYKLGDTVWYDVNGNGVQDAGEAGIPGVTVTLLDGNGQPLPNGTAVTDANGNYFFSVDAGTYSVQVDASNFEAGGALAGYTSTTPGGNLQTNTVTTENILTYDFGYSFASLGDFVWKDLNGNGLQDSGEPGVAGITVNLLGSDGVTVVASTTTDANGSYSFTKLQPGTYSVQFVAQAGEAFTTANAGSDDAKDSDVDSAGRTAAITLSAGETNNSVDAGLIPPASIGDFVWNDLNSNGVQDSGEPGMAGVTVNLLGSDGASLLASTTTDVAGSYSFTDLLPGTYYVQFVAPAETTFTKANVGNDAKDSDANTSTGKTSAITLSIGEINNSVDAGLKESLSLSCPGNLVLNPSFELNTGTPPKYWTNGTAGPINVPVVDGKNAAYINGSKTMYQKVNVIPGNSYTLTFYSGSHNPSIQTVKLQYFTKRNAAIGKAVTHTIVSDLEISGFGGPYSLTLDPAPSNAAYMKIMVSANNKDYAKVDKLCLQAGTPPATASIGDFVWNDLNSNGVQDSGEPGLAGVTVNLLGSDGASLLASTTTDVAGSYSFTDLLPGTYYVQFVAPEETSFTTANAGGNDAKDSDANTSTGKTSAITLSIGEINNSVDAGLKESLSLSCPGNLVLNPSFEMNTGTPPKYWTNGTAGPINVPVVDGKNAAYINGSGVMYQRVNVIPGNSYTLTFYSGSHNPSIQTVKIQYFTSGGSAIGTASVHTITSDLEISGFGGPYSLTLDPAPSNAAYMKIMVSANNKDYAKVDKLCLQAGTPPATASIGDFVWNDLNSNGVQDSGEPGMAGVTVNLLGSDGASLLASTTTDVAGSYSFTGLQPGTYYVQFAAPAESSFTTANAGSDDTQDSDADAASGKTGPIVLVSGQTDSTVDAGLKSTIIQVNYCSYVRSPGFWKNYSNHMSDEAFLDLISHTQDFSYLTLEQALTILSTNNGATNIGISELDGVDASYLKFLLTSELNAAWNGQENAAAPGGMLGTGNYQGTGLTVNQVLHQAYLDRNNFSPDQKATLEYLGAGGENADQNACLVQS